MNTQNRTEWLAMMQGLGASVEPDGSGCEVGHIDGEEVGRWDPRYAGVGMGWIHVSCNKG